MEGPLEPRGGVEEHLDELGVELVLHPGDIVHGEVEHLRVLEGLHSEVTDHFHGVGRHLVHHLVDVHFVLDGTQDQVQLAEEIADLDLDVNNILLEGQHKPRIALYEEEDLFNEVGLVVDILINGHVRLLEQWTDPPEEVLVLILQERALRVFIIVKVHVGPHPQLEWQSIYELLCLLQVLLVVVEVELCQDLNVQIRRYLVVLKNLVQYLSFLLVA